MDVKQEKRIDDYWNIAGSRDLSDSWANFTQFTLLEEKPPDGYMWSGEINEETADIQARSCTTRNLENDGKNAYLKEKQKWTNEKLHLDSARRLRGICFIDPEDTEFKETIKNARQKLETPMAPAVPCKTMKNNKNCGSGASKKIKKQDLRVFWKLMKPKRMRMGESLTKYHESHIAGKIDKSQKHYNLVHKCIPMPQAMKIQAAKAAVDKEWEKLEKISAWNLTRQKQKRGHR